MFPGDFVGPPSSMVWAVLVGGHLLPLSWGRGRRPLGPRDGLAVQAAVEVLFEGAMVNGSLELRPHMSTVLE